MNLFSSIFKKRLESLAQFGPPTEQLAVDAVDSVTSNRFEQSRNVSE